MNFVLWAVCVCVFVLGCLREFCFVGGVCIKPLGPPADMCCLMRFVVNAFLCCSKCFMCCSDFVVVL